MNHVALATVEAFVAAADTGSFTRAAEQLDISPSAISRAVSRLEGRVGLQLFTRTTRRIQLTADGKILYDRYQRVLQELRAIEADALGQQDPVEGVLRISAPISHGRKVVLPCLQDFLQQHPGLRIETNLTDRYVDLLDEDIDAAFRIGLLPAADYIAHRIGSTRFGVYASPEYLDRNGRPENPGDLDTHSCVAFLYPGTTRRFPWRFMTGGRMVTHAPAGRLAVDEPETLVDVAATGFGMIYVQDYMVSHELQTGRLVPVLQRHWPESLPISLIHRQPRHLARRLTLFIDFVTSRFAAQA